MERKHIYSRCNLTQDDLCIREAEEMATPGVCQSDGDCEIYEQGRSDLTWTNGGTI